MIKKWEERQWGWGGPNSTIPFHVDVGIRKLNNEKTMAYEEAIK